MRKNLADNKAYSWLRDQVQMEKLVGQIVAIPPLPNLPTGFTPQECASFLYSKERHSVLTDVRNAIGKGSWLSDSFAGPPGIGKSALGLLAATWGFVNNYVVIYMVLLPNSGSACA